MVSAVLATVALLLSGAFTVFSQTSSVEQTATSGLEILSEERMTYHETIGEVTQSPFSQSRFGGGIGVITMPTDRLVPGFMMVLLYSRALCLAGEAEIALNNHFGVQTYSFSDIQLPMPIPPSAKISQNQYSWNYTTADVTFLFSPFLSRVRVGGGITMQHRSQSFFIVNEKSQGVNSYLYLYQSLMAGVNLKADYLLPLTQTLDIGFRGQAHGLFVYMTGKELYRNLPDVQLSGLIFLSVRL